MPVHEEVLRTANDIACMRHDWSFSPEEIVRALPHLNQSSVRTHVVSRCCKNAPQNHAHKWNYFHRIGRGRYQVEPKYRRRQKEASTVASASRKTVKASSLREIIHCVINVENGVYVAECLEFAVVTQGKSLEDVVANLRQAMTLHLEDEDLNAVGFVDSPRIQIVLELPLAS
jgi:predicted RNase H-like HicB family nuclease